MDMKPAHVTEPAPRPAELESPPAPLAEEEALPREAETAATVARAVVPSLSALAVTFLSLDLFELSSVGGSQIHG